MSRIIVTTCGTSLYTSSCWVGLNDPPLSTISLEDQRTLRKKQSKCEGAIMEAQREDPTGDTFAKSFDTVSWDNLDRLRDLPAELASLRVIQTFCKNKIKKQLGVNDKLLLLHADNVDAIFCAEVLHRVLKSHKLLGEVDMADSLWKVPELDPKNTEKFVKSIEKLWPELIKKMPWQNEDVGIKYYLNLTGGYKSTVMLLACFAYLKGTEDTHIFYLNEESGKDVLILGFDPSNPLDEGLSPLKIGSINPDTGDLISDSLMPDEL